MLASRPVFSIGNLLNELDSFLYTSVAPGSWNMHPESQCVPATRSGPLPEVPLGSKCPTTIE